MASYVAKIQESERISNISKNKSSTILVVDDLKLLMALTRKRTEVTYGHVHYCHKHSCCVNENHIDQCDLIIQNGYKVTDIPAVLEGKNSIWEL